MFEKVGESDFVAGEHDVLRFWNERGIFTKLRQQNAGKPTWSFLDGPITANNPMGVHHAWGRTYKDAYQRFWAMNGRELRYQNGFDCQGLWVEVEVEKQLGLGAKSAIEAYGIDKFVWECKKRVLKYASVQTEQSQRLGYWMDWDDPAQLRQLAEAIGTDKVVTITTPGGQTETGTAEELVARLGNPAWGGSYFTFSTDNNETIWTFLKKCFERKKVYRGYDVMPWSGRGGSAYSQMEVADGRKLTVHRALFVRFPLREKPPSPMAVPQEPSTASTASHQEYLLVWTTTPWTLTSNVAAMVNPDLEYVQLQAKRDGAIYYVAKDCVEFQRLAKEFKEGFGRPEWAWPKGTPKLKTIGQFFKEQGGYEIIGTVKGAEMLGWRYRGPFDDLATQTEVPNPPVDVNTVPFRTGHLYFESVPFDGEFKSSSWKKQIGSSLDKSLEEGIRTLAGLVKASFWFLHDAGLRENQSLPSDYFQWAGRQRLDYALRCSGVLGGLRALNNEAGAAADELVNFVVSSDFNDPTAWDPNGTQRPRFLQSIATVDDLMTLGTRLFSQVKELALLYKAQTEFLQSSSVANSHRIIDGGRDFKGNPNVVAGEGTGIVHSAPGCGDIDHAIGEKWNLAVIAPLGEDGTFQEGFGPFTGKNAVAPETVDLVIEQLKEKGLLVAVEQYPHIYPFCWRTGDELVFRLVDEWFINMDWRQEIIDVVQKIDWLPDSIQGRERETEWLTNMRDWMISKKRFWGLALPIWINPEDPSDFEVIGSLAELKERAVEGWDAFEGHTPHKPWIDAVKIKSSTTGATLSRIPDVGNPWLDAGIVPFSTMGYNFDPEHEFWKKWYPADLVTECFPGQFRNWFYSMLALSTMMRHGETDNAEEKKPFRTLLGHRLVMNEAGKPMHKSDGTAIWFEEAAEQLGVDTMRWMYLAQNPAIDLKFGTRHPDQKVTLPTVNGPTNRTIDGVETCLVTSGPSDEVRRQVLIPLWNSYAFFVNYARLDGFNPSAAQVPASERQSIDRWILTRLNEVVGKVRAGFEGYDSPAACDAIARFVDDLSNWYIRRNRRRFWRSKDVGDRDKLAAYQTLYTVLTTLAKLMAPMTPFLAERMYGNLVASWDKSAPESVHLCEYPQPNDPPWSGCVEPETLALTDLAQRVVRLGHRLRETADRRVRQPLREVRVIHADESARQRAGIMQDVIRDELNVKELSFSESASDLVTLKYRANPASLGKKHGRYLNDLRKLIPELPAETLAPLSAGGTVNVEVGGTTIELVADDVHIDKEHADGWVSESDGDLTVALFTTLDTPLLHEGMARDLVRHIQQLRKDADLEIEQRICVGYQTDDPAIADMLATWSDYIRGETLANELTADTPPADAKSVIVGEAKFPLWMSVVK
jgi:isoleucyl-tRNA synthetase